MPQGQKGYVPMLAGVLLSSLGLILQTFWDLAFVTVYKVVLDIEQTNDYKSSPQMQIMDY